MRFIGIDPGLATVGIGVLDSPHPQQWTVVDWLTIQTEAGRDASDRLLEIHTDLAQLLSEFNPDMAVVERLFFASNETTAMDVSQARGVILLALEQRKIPILEPTPMQLKSAIAGDGKADKRMMQDMLVRTLNLAEIPKPDDAADALGLALYGAMRAERLVAIDMRHET